MIHAVLDCSALPSNIELPHSKLISAFPPCICMATNEATEMLAVAFVDGLQCGHMTLVSSYGSCLIRRAEHNLELNFLTAKSGCIYPLTLEAVRLFYEVMFLTHDLSYFDDLLDTATASVSSRFIVPVHERVRKHI